jgi:hypothetical protein
MKTILATIFLVFASLMLALDGTEWILDEATGYQVNDWRSPVWIITSISYDENRDRTISPFYSFGASINDEIAFGANSDFQPDDGWVLLHAYLGNSLGSFIHLLNPYVVLYNKERGIVRYFFKKREESSHSQAFAQMRAFSNTGILSSIHTNEHFILSLDKLNGNSMQGLAITKYLDVYSEAWKYADFHVGFDPRLQNENNILQFRSQATDVFIIDASINGKISQSHSTVNQSSNINEIFQFGNSIHEYIKRGNSLRNAIISMPDTLTNRGALQPFLNKLTSKIGFLSDTGIISAIPYMGAVAGVVNFFSGNSSGTSVINYTLQVSITGTATLATNINSFTIRQPGIQNPNPAILTSTPFYNSPLGVIGIENAPQFDMRKRHNSNFDYSIRLTHPSSGIIANDASGLIPIPIDVKISLNFKLHGGHWTNGFSFPFADYVHDGDWLPFIENYRILTPTGRKTYFCYTQFVDFIHSGQYRSC